MKRIRMDQLLMRCLLCAVGAAFAVMACAMLFIVYRLSRDVGGDYPILLHNKLYLSLPTVLLITIPMLLVHKLPVSVRIAERFTLLFTLIVGCIWVLLMPMSPRWDQLFCKQAGATILAGDLNSLANNNYIAGYPYQIGYCLWSALWQAVWGDHSDVFMGLLNVIFLTDFYAVILWIVRQAFPSRRVRMPLCLLMVTCVPPLMLCNLLYGNLPGMTCAISASALTYRYTLHSRKADAWLSLPLYVIACLFKQNSIIVGIAVGIVLLIMYLQKRDWCRITYAIAIPAVCLLSPAMLQKLFEMLMGQAFTGSVPMMAYLVMGLQDSERMAGWYNGYTSWKNFIGMSDAEIRTMIASDLQAAINRFRTEPGNILRFYVRKISAMWTEATYGCMQINRGANLSWLETPQWLQYFYSGHRASLLEYYMTAWSTVLYGSFSVGCFRCVCRKEWSKSAMTAVFVPALIVFGTMLYHGLFEAKSLYAFTCLPLLMVVAAIGFGGKGAFDEGIDQRE